MSTQPEALRMADQLADPRNVIFFAGREAAADKLRRLHTLNAELLEALKSTTDLLQVWIDGAPPYDEAKTDREVLAKARTTTTKATGEQK